MLLDKNKEIDIFKNIFKDNLNIDSIFIDSWDVIYIFDKNEEQYIKSDYSFYNFIQYKMFINCILNKSNEYKHIESNYYSLIGLNIEAYIHLWNTDDFWVVLKRIPVTNIA